MESSASRLLHALSLFTARPQWTATELAERLEVTTRTVRRDMADLRDLGYPIEAVAGRAGGYRLGPQGKLPPLLLTDDEAVTVAVGLRAAAAHGIADHDEAAISAMAKLEQVLPAVLRERVLALHESAVMVGKDAQIVADPQVLLQIAHACHRHERIRFTFRRGEDVEAQRRVEPYGLVCLARRWYTVAWDLDRAAWRTFRADRISDVELTGHTFDPRDTPDIESMVVSAVGSYPYEVQAEIFLDMPHDEAVREVSPTVGALEPFEGGTVLRVGADDVDWLARFVAGLPCDTEVRSPPELRAALRRLGQRLAVLHKEPDEHA